MSFVRQVVHVFVGDVRRFWPALLGLGGVIAFHRLEGLPLRRLWSLGVPGGLDIFPLLYAAITVLVVQHHSVIDDRSFWNVRPISRGAILASKLAFVGLFLCVIPVAVQIEWLLALAGGGDPWPAAADSLLYQGAFLALVAAGAAVTRNVADFLTLALVAWVGTAIVTGLGESPFLRMTAEDVVVSRGYLLRWAWAVIGIGLLVSHYRRPRAVRAAVVGTILLLGATAAVRSTWIDLVPSPLEPQEWTPYLGAERISVRISSLTAGLGGGAGGEPSAVVTASLVAEGLGGSTLLIRRSRSTVRAPQWTVQFAHPSRQSGRSAFAAPSVLDVLNGWVRIDDAEAVWSRGRTPGRQYLTAPLAADHPSEFEALRGARSISLDVDMDVFEPRLSEKVPDGAAVALRGGVLSIDGIDRLPGSVRVSTSLRRPSRALSSRFPGDFAMSPAGDLIMLHRELGEYLIGVPVQAQSFEHRAPEHYVVPGSSLYEGGFTAVFDSRALRRRDDPPIPDEWLESAELYLVEPGYAGSFSRSLDLDVDEWPELNGPSVTIDPRSR